MKTLPNSRGFYNFRSFESKYDDETENIGYNLKTLTEPEGHPFLAEETS